MDRSAVSAFTFSTAASVRFGWGSLAELGQRVSSYGDRVLVVCGRRVERVQPCLDLLDQCGKKATLFELASEPKVEDIERGILQVREGFDWVLGFGGGSVLDAAKALAIMAPQPGSLMDYLEVIGRAQPFPLAGLPVVAVPTTAGTGSEVTRNAVIASPDHRVKISLRHDSMLPALALVDPSLACSLPAPLTAATGLDALTQLIEAFVSRRANPLTDACCRQGIPRALRSLEKAVHAPEDPSARTDMALASLYSGMALANAGLGAVHGIAGPLGGMHPSAPHGALCAVLLPHSLERLHAAIRNIQPTSTCLFKLEALAEMILDDPKASITEALSWLHAWVASFALPSLRHYGLSQQECPLLAEKALASSSIKGHPVDMTPQEVCDLVQRAY